MTDLQRTSEGQTIILNTVDGYRKKKCSGFEHFCDYYRNVVACCPACTSFEGQNCCKIGPKCKADAAPTNSQIDLKFKLMRRLTLKSKLIFDLEKLREN
jgi:hypothetical protein